MERMRWPALVAFIALSAVALPACETGGDAGAPADTAALVTGDTAPRGTAAPQGPLPAGVTAEQVQQGQQVFTGAGNCYTCHGQAGEGGPLAPDLRDNNWMWVQAGQQDMLTQIETLVRTGVSQPREYPAPMPPMGGASLSDAQIRNVAAYVLSISQTAR